MSLVVDYDFDFSILHHPHARVRGSEIYANNWGGKALALYPTDNANSVETYHHPGLPSGELGRRIVRWRDRRVPGV